MQYLIGLDAPMAAWMGLLVSGAVRTARSPLNGLHWYACRVQTANFCSSFGRDGRSMLLKVPWNSPAIYCTTECVGAGTPGCGHSGFASEVTPLPLATSNCFPLGVTRTDVGYQPTGINPSERLFPGLLTSKTAIRLLSAL